jgi:hypothetical protein
MEEHSGTRTLNKDRFNARRTQDYRRFRNDKFDKAAARNCRDRSRRFDQEVQTHRSDCTSHLYRPRTISHSRATPGMGSGAAHPVTHASTAASRTIFMSIHVVGDTGARLSVICGMLEQTCAVSSELLSGAGIRNNEIDSIVVSADLRLVENISALKAISAKMARVSTHFPDRAENPPGDPAGLCPRGYPCAGPTRQSAAIAEAAG